MLNDEHNAPDTIPVVGSNHDGSASRVQLSANTRARLKKLARWRIDPALLQFPKRGPEFEGGYAIVSRAFLASSLNETKEHVAEPSHGELKCNDRVARVESGKRDQESESGNPEASPNEDGTEEEDQEFDLSGQGKAVAVKKMKMEAQDHVIRILGLTLREAEFLVKLSHERIIELEGFVEDVSNNVIWLVFPWESNGNLKAFIASADWEIPERISLIYDVASGVEYLHGRKPPICHGDLKSVNILINSECHAVITDFGSARHPVSKSPNNEGERTNKEPQPVPSLEAMHCPSTNTITLTRNHFTLRWAAPELLEDGDATLASDIWALGWVAYEVMTNTIPFQDVKDSMVIKRVVRGDLPSTSSDARMLLIQALCTLMTQCWNVEPRKRPSAKDYQNSIGWIPMIAPDPTRTEGTADLANRSPELLRRLGLLYRRHGDLLTAAKYFTKALVIYTDRGDNERKARTLHELAQIKNAQTEYNQAFTFAFECLQIYTDIGNRRGRGEALWSLGDVHRRRQEYPQATACYTECLQILTDLGDRKGRASALWGLADVHRVRNHYSEAIAFYSEDLQIRIDIGDRRGRAAALLGLAEVHRSRNEYSQAVALYSECLQIRTDIGDRRGRADALRGLAEVHMFRNEYSQAVAFYSECLQIRTDIGDRAGRASALWGLAEVHRLRNEYTQAVAFYSECLQLRIEIGDRGGTADALWGLAGVHQAREEYSQAVASYTECLQIRTDIGNRRGRAATLRGLAEVHRLQKEYNQGMALLSEALTISTEIGDRYGTAFTLQYMGEAYGDQHDHSSAIHNFEQAAGIYKQIGNPGEAFVLERAEELRRLMEQRTA